MVHTIEEQWRFIEAKAAEMGVKDDARRKWRERGHVPHRYRLPLMQEAARSFFQVDPNIFDNVPKEGRPAA